MSRRRFLRYGVGAVAGGLLTAGFANLLDPGLLSGEGATSSTSATSSASSSSTSFTESGYAALPDYAEFLSWLHSVSGTYSGTTLDLTMEAEFTPYTAQLMDNDFYLATGIADQYSIKPYSLQLSDVSIMFNTKSTNYDVYSLDTQNLGVFANDSISPSELAQTYPSITDPNLDIGGFSQFLLDRVATYPPVLSQGGGGNSAANIRVLPLDTPTMVQYFRTDVYDKLGLALPTTWDEYFDDLKAIQKSGLTPFAAVSQAAPDISIIYEYLAHLASFGGNLWEVDGNTIIPAMNSDVAIAALENFVRFEPYSDPASFTFTWDEVFASLGHGASATGLLWNEYSTWINEPSRSPQAGNFGYKMVPAGPQGSFSTVVGSGVGVSRYSKKPEAAWLWSQLATAKGTQEAMILNQYHVYPTRPSALDATEVANALSTNPFAMASLVNQIWNSNDIAALIGFPNWFDALAPLSNHLNTAWRGSETPAQALAAAQTQIESLGTLTF